MKFQGHSISSYLVFTAVLGAVGLFVACSGGNSGGSAPESCEVAGMAEACDCIGGAMGERLCGEDLVFGACIGCPDTDPNAPVDDRCFRCLDADPFALLCGSDDTVEQAEGNTACVDGSSVTACNSLAGCCEMFGRSAGAGEACGGCLERFTGEQCESCANFWEGPGCQTCSERYAGINCDRCGERFTGPACGQCAERLTGPNCDECVEGFTGPNCQECTDPRFTGPDCNQCTDGFSGGQCAVEFIAIEGGSFQMGGDGEYDGQPIHTVAVPSFQISKTEVTVRQYRSCVDAGACTTPRGWDSEPGDREAHPVVDVTWTQAQDFAAYAGSRLPTEAQWEFAAKSRGQQIAHPWGNQEPTCELANFNRCIGGTAPVCNSPNGNTAQGLCDMGGSVSEWVLDDWHRTYEGAPADGSGWLDTPRASHRVFRGGSWVGDANSVRAAYRFNGNLSYSNDFTGFRLAR